MVRYLKFTPESTFLLRDPETKETHNYECLKIWMRCPDGKDVTPDLYCQHECWYRPIDAIVEWLYNMDER